MFTACSRLESLHFRHSSPCLTVGSKNVFATYYRDFNSRYLRKALYLSRRVKLHGTNQISRSPGVYFPSASLFSLIRLKNLTKDSGDGSAADVIIAWLSAPISILLSLPFEHGMTRMISYRQFLPRQIAARFIRSQRNAITIRATMFSAARIVTFQQRFSQRGRIIALIAAALPAHQGELFAKDFDEAPDAEGWKHVGSIRSALFPNSPLAYFSVDRCCRSYSMSAPAND